MGYVNELEDILRALQGGLDPGTAYGFYEQEKEQRAAKREARMAEQQAMREQQNSLINALSGTAMSSASQGSSLSDVLAELAAQSSFMGANPQQAFADPRLEAGLRELFPPSQVPYAPGVTPPLSPDASTSRRSIIAPAPTISADYKNTIIDKVEKAKAMGHDPAAVLNAVKADLADEFGPEGAEQVLRGLGI